jgi:hypothetical protein
MFAAWLGAALGRCYASSGQPPLGARVGVGVTGDVASWSPSSFDEPLCGASVVALAPRCASLLESSVAVGSVASSVGSVDSAVSVDSIVSADTGRGSTTRPTDVPVSPRASVP